MEDQIRGWLRNQGYPLEMRTAAAFRDAGFRVVQSEYYHDPETSDWRECDVIADMSWKLQPDGIPVRVMFVVECKTSREKPWLLFTSPGKGIAGRARVVQRVSTPVGREWLKRISQRHDIQSLSLFQVSPTPAYGIVQAFKSREGQDVTYMAAIAAAKAARAMTQGLTSRSGRLINKWAILALPMVVTEARLFNCCLDENNQNQLNVEEATSGDLLWRNPIAGLPHTIIKIVNTRHLEPFIKRAAHDAETLMSTTSSELNESADWLRSHGGPLADDLLFNPDSHEGPIARR